VTARAVLAALAALLVVAACRRAAARQPVTAPHPAPAGTEAPLLAITGTVLIAHGDPRPGDGGGPAYQLEVATDEAQRWQVTATADLLPPLHALDRRRARLWLDTTDAARAAPRVRRLEVVDP
jgi:hypothetical protein